MFSLIKECTASYIAEHHRLVIDSERVICLDISNGIIDGSCCLFFAKDQVTPLLVAKGTSTKEGKAVYAREFKTLQTLQRIGMSRQRQATPMPLGIWRKDGKLITLQSALSGVLMKNVAGRKLFSSQRISATADKVLRWWHHLQTSYGIRRIRLIDDIYTNEVILPLKRFQQRYLLNRDEARFLTHRYLENKTLRDVELPFMVTHGDFCTANMVLNGKDIGVIDWEFPLEYQLPFFDLFYFFSSTRFPFAGLRGESSHFESFINVFWGDNYFNQFMRSCIGKICEEYKMPCEIIPDLFVFALIRIANMKYEGFLKGNGIRESIGIDDPVSDENKIKRWQSFRARRQDVPFASIQNGVFENIRFVIRHGFPDFTGFRYL